MPVCGVKLPQNGLDREPHEPGVVGLLMGAQKVGSDNGKDLLTLTKRRKNASFVSCRSSQIQRLDEDG